MRGARRSAELRDEMGKREGILGGRPSFKLHRGRVQHAKMIDCNVSALKA